MSKIILKPCPKCGEEGTINEVPAVYSLHDGVMFSPSCHDSDCIGDIGLFDTRKAAAECWNDQPYADKLRAQVAASVAIGAKNHDPLCEDFSCRACAMVGALAALVDK